MKKIAIIFFIFSLLYLVVGPLLGTSSTKYAYAQTDTPTAVALFCKMTENTISGLFNFASCLIVKSIVPIVFILAFAIFAWGVTQYILHSGEEAKREKAKQMMIWGLVSLTVITAIWGFVTILKTTFSLETAGPKQEVSP